MTEFVDVDLPVDERGNDPNDFRWYENYVETLMGSEKPANDKQEHKPGGFELIRLDELIKNVTGTQYLIKPFLERDCIGTIFGDSDTYKSFIVLDMGLHLAGPVNPGMIAIDTLSTNIGNGDESDNKDMSRLLNNVNLFIRAPTGACVPIVSHVGHGDKERERGAYCIRGNVDFRILVKREGAPDERRCSMHHLKSKDGPLFDPASFIAEIVTLPGVLDSEGEESTSLVLDSIEYVPPKDAKSLPEKTEQCLVVLQDLHGTASENLSSRGYDPLDAKVQSKDWMAECVRRKVIKGKSQASEKAQFQRIKRELKDGKLILVNGVFSELAPPPDEG